MGGTTDMPLAHKSNTASGWAWFIGLWCAGVGSLGLVAMLLKGLIRLL